MSGKRFCVYILLILGIVYSCDIGTGGGGAYVNVVELLPPVSEWAAMNNSAWASWFASNGSSANIQKEALFDYLWKNDDNYNRLSEEGKDFWDQQMVNWGKLPKDPGWWEWHADSAPQLDLKYIYKTETERIGVIGGTPGDFWVSQAGYYTGLEAGKRYKYIFEAWTDSGSREIEIQYYGVDGKYDITLFFPRINLTTTHQRYELVGETLPPALGAVSNLSFRCGNQHGVFYIKMISITETKEEPSS